MSSVKLSASRNSNKGLKGQFRLPLLGSLFLSTSTIAAAENANYTPQLATMFISLLIVIGVIFLLAAIMKKFSLNFPGSGQIKVITSVSLGAKERIVVVEINGEQHLLGVSSGSVNHLLTLTQPINNEVTGESFKDKLNQLMNKQ